MFKLTQGTGKLLILVLAIYYILGTTAFISLYEDDHIFFLTPRVDELTNLENSESIINKGITGEAFWQEPGTFIYLAILHKCGFETVVEKKAFQLYVLNPFIILLLFFAGNVISPGKGVLYAFLYGISPLGIFFAMTLMKTTVSVFFYLLWLTLVLLFIKEPGKLKYGVISSLVLFAAFSIRQNILILLPVVLGYILVVNRKSKERLKIRQNVLISLLLIVILAGGAIGFASYLRDTPMVTLTYNGKVNFYISNNENYLKTMNIWPGPEWTRLTVELDSGRFDSLEYIREDFTGWLGIMGRKIVWEFTPYNYFRMYYWNYFTEKFSWFKTAWMFNLLLMVLSLTTLFFIVRIDGIYTVLGGIWLLFHAVNAFFLPGIARYNTVILPLTIILAVKGAELLIGNWKRCIVAGVIAILLLLNTMPGDFNGEYINFLEAYSNAVEGSMEQVIVPEGTRHRNDWMMAKAISEYNRKDYVTAWKTLKQVPDFYLCGIHACRVAERTLFELGLYFDAMKINSLVNKEEFLKRRRHIVGRVVEDARNMISSYIRHGELISYKRYLIADFYYKVISKWGINKDNKRELLILAIEVLKGAIDIEKNSEKIVRYRMLMDKLSASLATMKSAL